MTVQLWPFFSKRLVGLTFMSQQKAPFAQHIHEEIAGTETDWVVSQLSSGEPVSLHPSLPRKSLSSRSLDPWQCSECFQTPVQKAEREKPRCAWKADNAGGEIAGNIANYAENSPNHSGTTGLRPKESTI